MKTWLQKLDREYGFQLTEAEMDIILNEVTAAEPLFEQLNAVDVRSKTPFVRLDVKGPKNDGIGLENLTIAEAQSA